MLSKASTGVRIVLLIVGVFVIGANRISCAESAIDLLSGFDRDRIDAAYPPESEEARGELSKLVYRLRTLDPNTLNQLAEPDLEPEIGDVVNVEGIVEKISRLDVPTKLVEYLEFAQLFVIDVSEDVSEQQRSVQQRSVRLISSSPPQGVQVGDRVATAGVVVDWSEQAVAVVSHSVRWFPKIYRNLGQQLLSEERFDLGLLPGVAARNRRPLLAEDGNAFYAILATAAALDGRSDLPAAEPADPVALLRTPQELVGQWVHMELESVQVTRIAVPDSDRQEQLGRDHYFQIDAVGDLGGVVIKIENSDTSIPPATFQSRYPVSLVTAELPTFMREMIRREQGGEAIVAPLRVKFGTDGFFYRLWAYDSDFMSQHGGGPQFGPLLIAARFENLEPTSADPVGVGAIGTAAAIAILCGMAAIWWWQRRAWAADDAARRRRQASESEQVSNQL